MSSDNTCEKCSLPVNISVESFTVCEGRCAKWYHLECVSLTLQHLSMISGNIIWMCNECMVDFRRYRERTVTDSATNTCADRSIQNDINELKTTVAAIVNTLAQKEKPIPPPSSTPISSSLETSDCIKATFDPVCESAKTMAPSTEERREFSLYLTRIDKHATENDVSEMVSRSLAAPLSSCSEVVKLVPRWQNINTLDYISFKVVLDEKWRMLAMNPSTWPSGVRFREFVHRLNATWKPH